MIWNLIRWPLGQLILLVDFLTSPEPPERDPLEQAKIDLATRDMALYQFRACPFCVKTRRAMKRLGLNIELRDARHDPKWRQQLLAEGGATAGSLPVHPGRIRRGAMAVRVGRHHRLSRADDSTEPTETVAPRRPRLVNRRSLKPLGPSPAPMNYCCSWSRSFPRATATAASTDCCRLPAGCSGAPSISNCICCVAW